MQFIDQTGEYQAEDEFKKLSGSSCILHKYAEGASNILPINPVSMVTELLSGKNPPPATLKGDR